MGNRLRWDESQPGFYEVFYLTANHRRSGRSFWLRSTLLKTSAPRQSYSGSLWLASFDPEGSNLALHRHYPREDCRFSPGEAVLEIGDSRFEESAWHADFTQDGHRLSWNLQWNSSASDLWLVPQSVRRLGLNKADVCVPNVDVALYGNIEVDGERFEFDGDPAAQSHHWGRHYARGWLWAHCNDFDGAPGAWFEMLSVDLFGLGPLRLPVCMLAFHDEERNLSVAALPDLLRCRASYKERVWRAVFEKGPLRLEARITAPPGAFVAVPYVSPHSENYTCHNCCLCRAELRLLGREKGGWRLLRELHSASGAHAEFCTPLDTTPERFRFGGLLKP